MIAMQYSFVLPADYDMAVVRERIAVKGRLLDDLPGLAFKAYLHAERGESAENLYALRSQEEQWAQQTLRRGALAVVAGFEPVTWSIVRLSLWREAPAEAEPGEQRYRIGHVSAPAMAAPRPA